MKPQMREVNGRLTQRTKPRRAGRTGADRMFCGIQLKDIQGRQMCL